MTSPRQRDDSEGKLGTVPTFTPPNDGIRGFYRVVVDSESRYLLTACHQNIHAATRGDLRFLEINDATECIGTRNSVIGTLFLGDIVCVTKLARTQHFDDHFMAPKTAHVVLDK